MAKKKKIVAVVKLQVNGGQATPAPPVGPALSQHGVPAMDFCKAFNARTKDQMGVKIPVVIEVYADKTYSFITKNPPVSFLIKRSLGLESASGEPNRVKVGKLTHQQVEEIAKIKMEEMTAASLETAMKNVAGTARSMGILVE